MTNLRMPEHQRLPGPIGVWTPQDVWRPATAVRYNDDDTLAVVIHYCQADDARLDGSALPYSQERKAGCWFFLAEQQALRDSALETLLEDLGDELPKLHNRIAELEAITSHLDKELAKLKGVHVVGLPERTAEPGDVLPTIESAPESAPELKVLPKKEAKPKKRGGKK